MRLRTIASTNYMAFCRHVILSTVALRRKHAFNVPFCKTKRLMNSFSMHNAAIFNGFIVYSGLNLKFYDVVSLFFCFYLLLFEYNRFSSFFSYFSIMYCSVRNPAFGLQWIFNKAIYLSIYLSCKSLYENNRNLSIFYLDCSPFTHVNPSPR